MSLKISPDQIKTTSGLEGFLDLWLANYEGSHKTFDTQLFKQIATHPQISSSIAYKTLKIYGQLYQDNQFTGGSFFITHKLIKFAEAAIASRYSERPIHEIDAPYLIPYNENLAISYIKHIKNNDNTFKNQENLLSKILLHFPYLIDRVEPRNLKFKPGKFLNILIDFLSQKVALEYLSNEDKFYFSRLLEYPYFIRRLTKDPAFKSILNDSFSQSAIYNTVSQDADMFFDFLMHLKNSNLLLANLRRADHFLHILSLNQSQELIICLKTFLPNEPEELKYYLIALIQLTINYPTLFNTAEIILNDILSQKLAERPNLKSISSLFHKIPDNKLMEIPERFFVMIAQIFEEPQWPILFGDKIFNHLSDEARYKVLLTYPSWENVKYAIEKNILIESLIELLFKNLLIPNTTEFQRNETEIKCLVQHLLDNANSKTAVSVAQKYPFLAKPIHMKGPRKGSFSVEQKAELAYCDIDLAVDFIDNDLRKLAETNVDLTVSYLQEVGKHHPQLAYICACLCRDLGDSFAAIRLLKMTPRNSEDSANASIEHYSLLLNTHHSDSKISFIGNREFKRNVYNKINQLHNQSMPVTSYRSILVQTATEKHSSPVETTKANNDNASQNNHDNNIDIPENQSNDSTSSKLIETKYEYAMDHFSIKPSTISNFANPIKKVTLKDMEKIVEIYDSLKNLFSFSTKKISIETCQKALKAENDERRFQILQKYVLEKSNQHRDFYGAILSYFGEDFFAAENYAVGNQPTK